MVGQLDAVVTVTIRMRPRVPDWTAGSTSTMTESGADPVGRSQRYSGTNVIVDWQGKMDSGSKRSYPNSLTARHAILMATSASAPGAESLLAMVIRPNGCRPFLVESPGPP